MHIRDYIKIHSSYEYLDTMLYTHMRLTYTLLNDLINILLLTLIHRKALVGMTSVKLVVPNAQTIVGLVIILISL